MVGVQFSHFIAKKAAAILSLLRGFKFFGGYKRPAKALNLALTFSAIDLHAISLRRILSKFSEVFLATFRTTRKRERHKNSLMPLFHSFRL